MESEASDECSKRKKVSEIPSTSSEDSMPILPEELIQAILIRVPVKYLLQFKCVSKDWNDLISSPDFVKTHLSFAAKDYTRHISLFQFDSRGINMKYFSVSSLFDDDSVIETFDLDCPLKNQPRHVYVSGSVNGLICLSDGFRGLVIWNPSTREFTEVFNFVPPQTRKCWSSCGFGYDDVHDDYKVVSIFSCMFKLDFEAMIYSLKSYSMKTLKGFKSGMSYCGSAKFVNRKLHWITDCRRGGCITSIDLVDEKWGKVGLPCIYEDGELTLRVLGSDLSLLRNPEHGTHSDVWVMKEYGVKESWTKLYTIRCPEYFYQPLFMHNKGEILLESGSTFAIYNPKNDTITYREVTNVGNSIVAEISIESLVSPDLEDED